MKCPYCNGTTEECGCGQGKCDHCIDGVVTDYPLGQPKRVPKVLKTTEVTELAKYWASSTRTDNLGEFIDRVAYQAVMGGDKLDALHYVPLRPQTAELVKGLTSERTFGLPLSVELHMRERLDPHRAIRMAEARTRMARSYMESVIDEDARNAMILAAGLDHNETATLSELNALIDQAVLWLADQHTHVLGLLEKTERRITAETNQRGQHEEDHNDS